jgi:hypothetical protein
MTRPSLNSENTQTVDDVNNANQSKKNIIIFINLYDIIGLPLSNGSSANSETESPDMSFDDINTNNPAHDGKQVVLKIYLELSFVKYSEPGIQAIVRESNASEAVDNRRCKSKIYIPM